MKVLKFLLTTASFAKKFSNGKYFDRELYQSCGLDHLNSESDIYVHVVKHSIVLSKMRNSPLFARDITQAQLRQVKPKAMLPLMLKYHDHQLAILMTETLNELQLKNLSMIYQDWC